MASWDFIVIGGGIAGVSAAAELARSGRVLLLEREERLAYHTTGRSAAFFTMNYGNAMIRGLTAASGPFLSKPPDGFAEAPPMSPHPAVTVARRDQDTAFETNLAKAMASAGNIVEISPAEAQHPAVVKLLEVLHQQVLIIQQQSETIHGLQDEIQRLKDEIAHLKQHKSKPKIRPSQLDHLRKAF